MDDTKTYLEDLAGRVAAGLSAAYSGRDVLHLSIRGGSYRLRDFSAPTPRVFKTPAAATAAELRSSGLLVRMEPVSAEDLRHSLENEPGYWRARIREVNAAAGRTP
ncbi:MAG: hypothetical protein ACE15B_16635 [Bryobacteraceae bacterium]